MRDLFYLCRGRAPLLQGISRDIHYLGRSALQARITTGKRQPTLNHDSQLSNSISYRFPVYN